MVLLSNCSLDWIIVLSHSFCFPLPCYNPPFETFGSNKLKPWRFLQRYAIKRSSWQSLLTTGAPEGGKGRGICQHYCLFATKVWSDLNNKLSNWIQKSIFWNIDVNIVFSRIPDGCHQCDIFLIVLVIGNSWWCSPIQDSNQLVSNVIRWQAMHTCSASTMSTQIWRTDV